ncbi:EH signature domain-containing protein [Niveispirillum irakense]|uniref:EH signature domain-containing protein n=1 Tax=Niveispirillum irakense TaxID=34011 RepID=UPI000401C89F|nr:EH signature domain-containing protein [Niveispirillum irakense]
MTIAALKRHLEQSLARLQQNPPRLGRPDQMAAVAERLLRGQASDQQQRARANKVLQALTAFLSHGTVAGTLRHLCWGLTEPLPTGALLTRPQCKALLTEIERALAGGSLTASAWRGLLQGYFTADPATIDGAGRENWLALRAFLARSLPVLQQRMKAMPVWLATILDHAAVLSDNPCAGYAAALLSGDRSDLERLRDDLGIPPQSWFWRETVLAQVRAACAMADGDFRANLSTVLTALKDYPLLVNEGLTLLLPRYHLAADSRHDGLCALAVAHWGSPNIFAQAKWAQVSPDVKKMVQVWLAFQDLQTFFEILQADKTVDTRRFEFWLRYHRQMDYVRIALGAQAWHSNDPDLRELRKKGRDRVCRLEGGPGNLNAIIMKIGDFLLVEFSHTGNAAYGYPHFSPPFPLDQESVRLFNLKSVAKSVFQESHNGSWEDKFDRILSTELKIHADSRQRPMPSPLRAPLPPPPFVYQQPALTPTPAKPVFDMVWLREECRRRSIAVIDNRDKKGALWVRHKEQSDAFGRDLAAQGFRFVPGNGWWLK